MEIDFFGKADTIETKKKRMNLPQNGLMRALY